MDEEYDRVVIDHQDGKPSLVVPIYKTQAKFVSTLKEHFPDDHAAIDKYVDLVTKAAGTFDVLYIIKLLPRPLAKFLMYSGLINLFSPFFKYAKKTPFEVARELTDNKDLQTVLNYCFGDFTGLPYEASFVVQAAIHRHFWHGAAFPRGGSSEIALHIIPVIERAGGRVLVRARVESILLNDKGEAIGVKLTKGQEIHAPIIISDAGIQNTFASLLPLSAREKPEIKKVLDMCHPSCTAITAFVGLNCSSKDLNLPKRNTWLYPQGNDVERVCKAYADMSLEQALSLDASEPFIFISFPSAKDPTFNDRYPGKATCEVLAFTRYEYFKEWERERVHARGQDYEQIKNTLGKRAWEKVIK